jgi:hypothetical protein
MNQERAYYNRLFWAVFIIVAALVIAGALLNIMMLEIVLALLIIAAGLHKLEVEYMRRSVEEEQKRLDSFIGEIRHSAHNASLSVHDTQKASEYRIHKLDTKRADLETKIEQNYRELVKKIFDLENNMNVIAKAIRDAPQLLDVMPRSGRGSKSSKALKAKTVAKKAKKRKK